MISLWSADTKMPHFEKLTKNVKTDILIIGAGISGLLCAYELDRRGADYIVVEAKEICSGITKNTTAKITSQHGFIYDKLIKEFGVQTARLYYEANENALKKYKTLCKNIDCDFEIKDNFVYSFDAQKVKRELCALEKAGIGAVKEDRIQLPFSVAGAIKFENQAQFNVLKFLSEICKGLNIYEHTKVKELVGTTAICEGGKIEAKKIIVATHFPFLNKHGMYFMKLYQHRSYVIALEGAEKPDAMYVDEKSDGMSFRTAGKLLLIGGGDHRTGKKGGGFSELEDFSERYYPNAKIKYRWAAQDCMSLDAVPYIGRYSENTPNLFVSTGFNKWGMTSSMASADILCDLVADKDNRYAGVFSPSRSMFRLQLFVNSFEALTGIILPTKRRCPHMGCALKYNAAEHTWDCSCHGSRFEEDGTLIDNPATDDMKNINEKRR